MVCTDGVAKPMILHDLRSLSSILLLLTLLCSCTVDEQERVALASAEDTEDHSVLLAYEKIETFLDELSVRYVASLPLQKDRIPRPPISWKIYPEIARNRTELFHLQELAYAIEPSQIDPALTSRIDAATSASTLILSDGVKEVASIPRWVLLVWNLNMALDDKDRLLRTQNILSQYLQIARSSEDRASIVMSSTLETLGDFTYLLYLYLEENSDRATAQDYLDFVQVFYHDLHAHVIQSGRMPGTPQLQVRGHISLPTPQRSDS